MIKLYLVIFITFCSLFIDLFSADREIVVHLDGENRLVPIFIEPISNRNSGFSDKYLRDLEQIFRFDFTHNGTTNIVDKLSSSFYHFQLSMNTHQLSIKISTPSSNEESCFDGVVFTGYLNEDRRILHQLSDKIHEHLFGTKGIASTHILYTIKKGNEFSEIWEMDYDGGNSRKITQHSGYFITPAYIPPKRGYYAGSFIYTGYQTGQPKVYVASLKEGSARLLLNLPGNQLMPTISRQRNRIAFISDVAGNPDLFIQDFDPEKGVSGKPRHLYTAPLATQGSPSFSHDGTKVAFVSDKNGTPKIYVLTIPPSGTPLKEIQIQLISKFTKDNTAPNWSPDGTKIAYCAKVNQVRQIIVYDLLTGKERALTKGPGNKENPSWAPDSVHLVYNTTDRGSCELYFTNLKQAKPVKISSGSGEKRFPSWEPLGDL